MTLISRKEAKIAGAVRYFTGKPCLNGHVAERQTSNGVCLACVAERKAVYDKTYRIKHLEKLRAYDRDRPKRKVRPEVVKAQKSRYYQRHKERLASAHAAYRATNKEKRIEYFKTYKKENAAQVAAWNAKRRAAEMQRTPAWLSSEDHWVISEAYALAATRTKLFGFQWHVDHILPLRGKKVSGLHVPANLQVIPAVDNLRKANS